MKDRGTLPTLLHATVLVACFGFSVIAAGHGVGTIGLLLILGWNDYWLPQVLIGWLAIVGIVWSVLPFWGRVSWARAAGLLMAISWLLFLAKSESKAGTILWSLPFVAAMALWFERTFRPGAGRQAASAAVEQRDAADGRRR